MNNETTASRWRFSLKSLTLGIALLSLLLAVTHSGGQTRVMHRYSEARGGGIIYARHYGWPIPYLRAPTGAHAGMAADVFVPGLIIDLVLAVIVVAVVFRVWAVLRTARSKRSIGLSPQHNK
jgi:hypothetical protein